MLKKFADLLFDATVGLAKEYQQKTVELAKITAASYYLQVIQALRKHCVSIFLVIFFTLTLVVTVVVTPIALLMLAPWNIAVKMAAVCVLGILYAAVSLYFVMDLFSEKRWLRFSGSEELVEKVASKNGFKP